MSLNDDDHTNAILTLSATTDTSSEAERPAGTFTPSQSWWYHYHAAREGLIQSMHDDAVERSGGYFRRAASDRVVYLRPLRDLRSGGG